MNYSAEQLKKWTEIIDGFRSTTNKLVFEMWIQPLKLHSVNGTEVTAMIDDPNITLNMVSHYQPRIELAVRSAFGDDYTFRILSNSPGDTMTATSLNSRFTFENFVTGPSNTFAYAASLAVAEQPSEVYTPLFIYGDVGLGTTHLMNAIGNYIHAQSPQMKILLTTAESFTNELIEALPKKNGTVQLRSKMRNVDVLMVDDIHFLSKTTIAQEEFFHTFNDLQNHGKQIVLSSDRAPNEIPYIEDRLRSRFSSGLLVDIGKPDFETRSAILRRKADEEDVDLPYDVLEYIAEHINKSIRDLEGALTRVVAQSRLLGYPITVEFAARAIDDMVQGDTARIVTPGTVIDIVAGQFGTTAEEILSKKRNQEIVLPRQVAIYICRELTDLSTTQIGRSFGGRDHTTVMHSCEKISLQMKKDILLKKRVDEIIHLIRNN